MNRKRVVAIGLTVFVWILTTRSWLDWLAMRERAEQLARGTGRELTITAYGEVFVTCMALLMTYMLVAEFRRVREQSRT